MASKNRNLSTLAPANTGNFAVSTNASITGTLNTADVNVSGNLIVTGTTVTVNVATLDVKDLNITVAKGAATNAAANGAGITVDPSNAQLFYASSDDSWNVNKKLNLSNTLVVNGNLTLNSGLVANGSLGTATHVLHSNGSATYWAADDQGVTSVATGNGLTGGTITSTGTISAVGNTGIIANTNGLFVNSSYIATLTANNTTNAFGKTEGNLNVNSAATFTSTTQNSQFNSVGVGTAASGTTGEIRATNEVTAYYSDARLKTDIQKIDSASDKLKAITGVFYKNNDLAKSYGFTKEDRQVGVLAQDIQKVLPEAVRHAPFDIDSDGSSKSGKNYLTVKYDLLVPLLIEALKDALERIEKLESK